jgi:TRAP-type uncharacterized transport system substrate-binding protein
MVRNRWVALVVCLALTAGLMALGPVAGSWAKKKFYQIEISTIPAGFASYTIGVALAQLINKHSTWLRATALEGRGPTEHMKLLTIKPAKRKHYVFFNTTWDVWEARHRLGLYKRFKVPANDFKFIFFMGLAGNGMCTIDPDIKKVKDLEGKRCCFDSAPGKGRILTYQGVLKAAGVDIKKIRYQYSAGKAMADRLRDGLIQVGYTGSALIKPPSTHALSPFLRELVSTRKTYFISFPKAAVMAFKKKTGHPLVYLTVPPKSFGPLQLETLSLLGKPLGFCVHKSMPDKVVAEILRIVYKYAPKFAEYTAMGRAITRQNLAALGLPASGYHRAALKFFKANKIKLKDPQ